MSDTDYTVTVTAVNDDSGPAAAVTSDAVRPTNDPLIRPQLAELATGRQHTCALFDDGSVRCWGSNEAGQLGYPGSATIGDDEPVTRLGPVDVGARVVQITAGEAHTCALTTGGEVRCWGSGASGRLGYGNEITVGDDETPASVGAIDLGFEAAQIDAGSVHTCALAASGDVRCWGDDQRIGLANSNDVGDDETPASVGPIDLGVGAVQVAAANPHTCAVTTTADVRCWGTNFHAALGYPGETDVGMSAPPAAAGDVDVGAKVVEVVTAEQHTCALTTTGGVRCWGNGSGGQLGTGSKAFVGDDEAPASAGDVDVGGTASHLAAGFGHTCVVMTDGSTRCWGQARTGQTGLATTTTIGDDESPASVGPVDVGTGVTAIAASWFHSCAVTDLGTASCWGDGASGQLGTASTEPIGDSETPASAGLSIRFVTDALPGYWMVDAQGALSAFGAVPELDDVTLVAGVEIVDLDPAPDGRGLWALDSTGTVHATGTAVHHGDLTPDTTGEPTTLSPTPSGEGYWIFTTTGDVSAHGDAIDHGDLTDLPLNGAIVASSSTVSGGGYWLVGQDGGVFALGDARFVGSMGGRPINRPVVGITPDPDGRGYWLVADDGGVFAFDAPFRGSVPGELADGMSLNAPVTDLIAYGDGYAMAATDGGAFVFSDQDFRGSLGGQLLDHPIVAMTALP